MQAHLAQQDRHTSRSLGEWFVRAGILVWVIFDLITGWLKETGLQFRSMFTDFADDSIDFPAEGSSDFWHLAVRRQTRHI